MRYGTPYKGSKNKIAKWLIDQLPEKTNFYDLCAGGCAVTHAAMLHGRFKNFYANDIDDAPRLFYDAIYGKYKDECRWISREDFYALKDNDPYIRFCWSFGNNGFNYLYSKEVEPWKKALHFARVFGHFSFLRAFGIETDDASKVTVSKHHDEWKEKYIKWYCREILHTTLDELEIEKNLTEKIKKNEEQLRNYLLAALQRSGKRPVDVDRFLGTNGMAGHYFGKSQWEFPTREIYIKLQTFIDLPEDYDNIYGLQEFLQSLQRLQSLESLERLQSLESLESLQSLQRLQRLQSLQRLEITQLSYDKVKVKPDSVIYCDIPYRGTDEYAGEFDHAAFYDWCEKQTELVIVSEYAMPADRFVCVASIDKAQLLSGTGQGKIVKEGLFVPKHQLELYRASMRRLVDNEGQLLFDFAA